MLHQCWTVLILAWISGLQINPVSQATPQTDEMDKGNNGSSNVLITPGLSFNGKSALSNFESSSSTVSALIAIENWSKWTMLEPEAQISCGKRPSNLPETISPGMSEMFIVEKESGLTGVCGVLTYRLDISSQEATHYILLMWSVPYDLNTYSAYLAVGVANESFNSSSLFNELYYHSGPFQRVKAGNLAEYGASDSKVKVSGTMQQDTYRPIINISVMPTEDQDSFQASGNNFANRLHNPSLIPIIFVLFLLIDHIC